jgi:predicted RNA-binding Zn ribbon-like protein
VYSEGKFRWIAYGRAQADTILMAVADSAAELLTSDSLPRVRQCGGLNCGWLFLDTTRNRSRRWCDMKDCGNRAKVRRYRQRQAVQR